MANFFSDNKDLQFHLEHPLMRKIVELKERGFAEKDLYDFAPQNFEDAMDSYPVSYTHLTLPTIGG